MLLKVLLHYLLNNTSQQLIYCSNEPLHSCQVKGTYSLSGESIMMSAVLPAAGFLPRCLVDLLLT